MTDQAKPMPDEMQLWKERDYCHKYVLLLAKHLNCEVREVPGKLKQFAKGAEIMPNVHDNQGEFTDRVNWLRVYEGLTALAAGGEDEQNIK